MVKAIIEAVRNGLELIGLIKQRDAEENRPEVVAAKEAANLQAEIDRIRKDNQEAIKDHNPEKVREDNS